MGKGLRANKKKALRTIRRNAVKTDPVTEKRDAERFAKIQESVEAGKAARAEAEKVRQEQRLGTAEMDTSGPDVPSTDGAEQMEVDPPQNNRSNVLHLTKKKKLKLKSKKKKADGINTFHKKHGKGKRTGKKKR